jgi:hypothetical protein
MRWQLHTVLSDMYSDTSSDTISGVSLASHSDRRPDAPSSPMSRSFAVRLLVHACILLPLLWSGSSVTFAAQIDESLLDRSIVLISNYRGKDLVRQGAGFVVQADRFNGYVVTNAALLAENDTLTVTVPGSGAELLAQVLQEESVLDFAVLKVNGLDLEPLLFSATPAAAGESVWTAMKFADGMSLANGSLVRVFQVESAGMLEHSATMAVGTQSLRFGSVLLNHCGQLLGMNRSTGAGLAIDAATMSRYLARQNISSGMATAPCVSQLDVAREKAEQAAQQARTAQQEAVLAREVATGLESRLNESNQRNDSLEKETREARDHAVSAMLAARNAGNRATEISQELERQAASLKAETSAIVESLAKDRRLAEERFQQALIEQKAESERRESLLLAVVGALFLLTIVAFVFLRVRTSQSSPVQVSNPASTVMHKSDLSEYVLDGRDEDGIRYLLRISGDQLVRDDGVVIGRNPKDSPYIINHSDVSRKHARMKVMKDRVFIEDLGSTNGTSVNGQAIEDKGPVSLNNGDQVIIGSVVMKLRVLDD